MSLRRSVPRLAPLIALASALLAPAPGATVTSASDSPAVMVPASVTLPPGATTTRFPIATWAVPRTAVATSYATTPDAASQAALRLLSAMAARSRRPGRRTAALVMTGSRETRG